MEINELPKEFGFLCELVEVACGGLEEGTVEAFQSRAAAFDPAVLGRLTQAYNWLAEDNRSRRLSRWIDAVAGRDLRAFKKSTARRFFCLFGLFDVLAKMRLGPFTDGRVGYGSNIEVDWSNSPKELAYLREAADRYADVYTEDGALEIANLAEHAERVYVAGVAELIRKRNHAALIFSITDSPKPLSEAEHSLVNLILILRAFEVDFGDE